MHQKFEYKFIRMGEGWLGLKKAVLNQYQEVIRQETREGWRLVQLFAPGTGVYGMAGFLELVFEREVTA